MESWCTRRRFGRCRLSNLLDRPLTILWCLLDKMKGFAAFRVVVCACVLHLSYGSGPVDVLVTAFFGNSDCNPPILSSVPRVSLLDFCYFAAERTTTTLTLSRSFTYDNATDRLFFNKFASADCSGGLDPSSSNALLNSPVTCVDPGGRAVSEIGYSFETSRKPYCSSRVGPK